MLIAEECPKRFHLKHLKNAIETEGPVKVIAGPADLMFRAITDEQAEKFPDLEQRFATDQTLHRCADLTVLYKEIEPRC